MRVTKLLATSVLSLLLGTTGLLYGQEQRDAKPEETRPEAAKPEAQDKEKAARSEDKSAKQDAAKTSKETERAGQSDRHVERAAGQGARIPDDKFRAHFGREHKFAINHPNVINGQPHFQYGGYSFTIVDAWPAGWAYTDQCYIDYIDGEYFLLDLLHPGMQVALVVVL